MITERLKMRKDMGFSDENLKLSYETSLILDCDYKSVFGLGERYNKINHVSENVVNIVEEKFCNQGRKTYFPLPFFMLDNNYGFYLDTRQTIEFSFDDRIEIRGLNPEKDEVVILKGSYKEMIADFIELTGKIKPAPKWVFGPWISAHRWNSQEIVNDVSKKLKDLRIPVTTMVLEQWSDEATFYIFNKAEYPDKQYLEYGDFDFGKSPWYDPKAMIEKLHDEGIRLLLWQCPVVKKIPDDEPFNQRHENDWNKSIAEKLTVSADNGPYFIPEGNWFNGSMIPDFSNDRTTDWWFKNRQYLIDIGVDGFKTDGGEFIHSQAINSIGETEKELKNNYPLEYVKAYSDFVGKDRVVFSRAGYTSVQSHSLIWAGDQKSTFEELQAVYRAGINASLCGQINWGFDIAGFSGELPSRELYYRANQLAVFTPIMQVHSEPVGGQFSATDPVREFNNERTIWNMAADDGKLLDDIRKLYYLRMNILPYIYSEYLKALESKTTLMKHMKIEYEGEYSENQYIFGELLVCPVLSDDSKIMEMSLPEGDFYDVFSKEKANTKVLVDSGNLQKMYVFARSGTALVSKSKDMFEYADNSLEVAELYLHLYGAAGEYRYVDEANDFTISWQNDNVSINGNTDLKLNYIFYN